MKQLSERKIWVISALGAGVVGALVLMLFHGPGPAPKTPTASAAQAPAAAKPSNVNLTKLDPADATTGESLLREEATLRDPTPLFLPTPWNAGESAVPKTAQREPGGSFPGYAPKLTYAELELQVALPDPVAVPKKPADAFAIGRPAQSFLGFGQGDLKVRPLAARGAYVEVIAAGDGRSLLALALTDARPPNDTPWQPLQFLVAIDAAGVVRPPVLTESSRVAAVDGYFQNYLTDVLHVGERLGPGFYRICIGP